MAQATFRDSMDLIVPQPNTELHKILFVIEACMRELIIDKMEALNGPRGYKQCLPPGEIIRKYQESKAREKATPWVQLTPHHPIYYLDFPELSQVIGRRDNWKSFFSNAFHLKEPDQIVSALRMLEPIRNAVAHNRRTTEAMISEALGVLNQLLSCLGQEYVLALVERCTAAPSISRQLSTLQQEMCTAMTAMQRCQEHLELTHWPSIRDQWWLDSDYLGADISSICTFFALTEEYARLPRKRGDGHIIERWEASHNVKQVFTESEQVIESLYREVR